MGKLTKNNNLRSEGKEREVRALDRSINTVHRSGSTVQKWVVNPVIVYR